MYFQYRLYSIIVTFINKIFLIRLWLIRGISDQRFCFETIHLHGWKAVVIMPPAWFPSRHLPARSRAPGQWSGQRRVPEPRGSTGYTGSAWSLCLPLPAAARRIRSKRFLPFSLSFLTCKTGTAIQPPFGKRFEVHGQRTSRVSWYFPALPSTRSYYPPWLGKQGACAWPAAAPHHCCFSSPLCPGAAEVRVWILSCWGYGQQPLAEGQSEQGAERRLAHLRPCQARHGSVRSQLLSTNK